MSRRHRAAAVALLSLSLPACRPDPAPPGNTAATTAQGAGTRAAGASGANTVTINGTAVEVGEDGAVPRSVVSVDGILAGGCVDDSGPPQPSVRAVGAFTGVDTGGSADVRLTQAATAAVVVHAPAAIAPLITTEVKDGVLLIGTRGCFKTRTPIRVDVSAPGFDRLSSNGSGDLGSTTALRGGDLTVQLHGSGDASLELERRRVAVVLRGSGDVELRGRAEVLDAEVAGSGTIEGDRLPVATATARVRGSGTIRVNAARTLDAHVAGSGDVEYLGSPAVTEQVSGSGDVRAR